MEWTRREYQYLAKELNLCRANAKSESIHQALMVYLETHPEERVESLLKHMPPPSVKKGTTPMKARTMEGGAGRGPVRRSARKMAMMTEEKERKTCVLSLVTEEEQGEGKMDGELLPQTLSFEEEMKEKVVCDDSNMNALNMEEDGVVNDTIKEVQENTVMEMLDETINEASQSHERNLSSEDVTENHEVGLSCSSENAKTEIKDRCENNILEDREMKKFVPESILNDITENQEPEEETDVELRSNASEDSPVSLKCLTLNMDALHLDEATEVKKLVESHDHLHFLPNGRVRCVLTQHEMIPTKTCISEYLSGKKYAAAATNFEKYEPMFVQDPLQPESRLYCTVTNSYIKKGIDEIKKHMEAKKYKESFPDWKKRNMQVHLKGIPSPAGVKTYFSSP